MKIFWSILALLTLVALGLIVVGGDSSGPLPQAVAPNPLADVPANDAPRDPEARELGAAPIREDERRADLPPAPTEATVPTDPAPAIVSHSGMDLAARVAPSTPQDEPVDEAMEALVSELIASADQRREQSQPPPATAQAPAAPDANAPNANAPVEESSSSPAAAEDDVEVDAPADGKTAVKIVRQDDGTSLIDDRFVVGGSGTKDDPYRLTWELLVSASQTFRPRSGQMEIPARIQMFDGTYVKLTGYLAFPLASQTIKEALAMLNQWDGCCVGVPPSPYDAVEVTLATPVDLQHGHYASFGSVQGKFKIDPYLVNNWLVGLYVMEDATMEIGF